MVDYRMKAETGYFNVSGAVVKFVHGTGGLSNLTPDNFRAAVAALQSPLATESPEAAVSIVRQAVPELELPLDDFFGVPPADWANYLQVLIAVLSGIVAAGPTTKGLIVSLLAITAMQVKRYESTLPKK